jgi:hypothetical protein
MPRILERPPATQPFNDDFLAVSGRRVSGADDGRRAHDAVEERVAGHVAWQEVHVDGECEGGRVVTEVVLNGLDAPAFAEQERAAGMS